MAILEGVLSVIAMVGALLLIWGMLPIIRAESRLASRNLMVGVMILLVSGLVRRIWFGPAYWILSRTHPDLWDGLTYMLGPRSPHLYQSLWLLASLFFFYRFTWFLIPSDERARYNLLTAPFWPRHVGWFWPRRVRREEDA